MSEIALKSEVEKVQEMAEVSPGFNSGASFDLMQRMAKMFSSSSLVPKTYRSLIEVKKGRETTWEQNPNALPNAIIAVGIATRMKSDPLMVMQNLHIIEGRPSWSSPYIIAAINSCGRFNGLRFEMSPVGPEKTVDYTVTEWQNNERKRVPRSANIREQSCRAWAIEKATGERLNGPTVTMDMAVAEGWFTKDGSKWQTMPELMLHYRSAAFFGRLYAPELLMGLPMADEIVDILPAEVVPAETKASTLTRPRSIHEPKPAAAPAEDAPIGVATRFEEAPDSAYATVSTQGGADDSEVEGEVDGPDADEAPAVSPAPAAASEKPAVAVQATLLPEAEEGAPRATPGVIGMIRQKMAHAGFDDGAMQMKFGIASIENLTREQGAKILDYFRAQK